jgi:hypothetical protein
MISFIGIMINSIWSRQNPFLCEASVKKYLPANRKTIKPYVVSIDLQSGNYSACSGVID